MFVHTPSQIALSHTHWFLTQFPISQGLVSLHGPLPGTTKGPSSGGGADVHAKNAAKIDEVTRKCVGGCFVAALTRHPCGSIVKVWCVQKRFALLAERVRTL